MSTKFRVIAGGAGALAATGLVAYLLGRRHAARRARAHYETMLGLRHDAHHDPLTGALNRRGFERAYDTLSTHATWLTVIACDLDNFKTVNDVYGHEAGDAVLVAFTEELMRIAERYAGVVHRRGGDEFFVLVAAYTSERPVSVATAIRDWLHDLTIGAHIMGTDEPEHATGDPLPEVPVAVSVGAAIGRANSTQGDLVRLADRRLIADKAARKSMPQHAGATPTEDPHTP